MKKRCNYTIGPDHELCKRYVEEPNKTMCRYPLEPDYCKDFEPEEKKKCHYNTVNDSTCDHPSNALNDNCLGVDGCNFFRLAFKPQEKGIMKKCKYSNGANHEGCVHKNARDNDYRCQHSMKSDQCKDFEIRSKITSDDPDTLPPTSRPSLAELSENEYPKTPAVKGFKPNESDLCDLLPEINNVFEDYLPDLRDQIAIKIMEMDYSKLINSPFSSADCEYTIANNAYKMADAMIKARG